MCEALRKHPEVNIDALLQGQPFSPKVQGPEAQSAIGPDDVKLIRRLVTRLQDNDHLDEFELIYRSGRVKMDGGLDLVFPEEMKLLERLAGLKRPRRHSDWAVPAAANRSHRTNAMVEAEMKPLRWR